MIASGHASTAYRPYDPVPDELAELALDTLVGEAGLSTLTLLDLHEFLWHSLPVKWIGSAEHHLAIAAALGRYFDRAGMSPQAAACTSPLTERIIRTYASHGDDAGAASYREALDESGLVPPDTPSLQWGTFIGPEERSAFLACVREIEAAVMSGELVIGSRRWKATSAEITQRRLRGVWLDRVHAERMAAWASANGGALGRRRLSVMAEVGEPVCAPAGSYRTLRWLLRHADRGLPLTERHNMIPMVVTEAVERFGWHEQLIGTLNREHDVFPLRHLHEMAGRDIKAVRRTGRRLVLTSLGRRMLTDDELLHHHAAAAVLGNDHGKPSFGVAAREAALVTLLASGARDSGELLAELAPRMEAAGWHVEDPSERIDEALRHEIAELRHRLWALDLLRFEGSWTGPLTLTQAGIAATRTVLRQRAIRPRHRLGQV